MIKCKVCATGRQRNIVNFREITSNENNYVCLECLLFPSTATVRLGRYGSPFMQRKIVINAARKLLPECSFAQDVAGYWIVDRLALRELRESISQAIPLGGAGA